MKKRIITILIIVVMLLLMGACNSAPQSMYPKIDKTTAEKTIQSLRKIISEKYIDEKMAEEMVKELDSVKNRLLKIEDPVILARELSEAMLDICKDKHFYVDYHPEMAQKIKLEKDKPEEFKKKELKFEQAFNYGFFNTKVLPGNIGHIQVIQFCKSEEAMAKAAEAMKLVENCNAVILDFQRGRGGHAEMEQMLCSYFLPQSPQTLLNTFHTRGGMVRELKTLIELPGKRLDKMPLYILTSGTTFSAQEGVTYNLKNLKRATIVGEKTAGGANPYELQIVHGNFFVAIPFMKSINPITKTNWEGVGIEPDVKTSFEDAFPKAYTLALSKSGKSPDEIEKIINDEDSPLFQSWWIKKGIEAEYGDKVRIMEKRGRLYFEKKDKTMSDGIIRNQLIYKEGHSFNLLFNNSYHEITLQIKDGKIDSLTLNYKKTDKKEILKRR